MNPIKKCEDESKSDKGMYMANITNCKKCKKLYLKFDYIPTKQPCPHCLKDKT